jgi:hypothetical protein
MAQHDDDHDPHVLPGRAAATGRRIIDAHADAVSHADADADPTPTPTPAPSP